MTKRKPDHEAAKKFAQSWVAYEKNLPSTTQVEEVNIAHCYLEVVEGAEAQQLALSQALAHERLTIDAILAREEGDEVKHDRIADELEAMWLDMSEDARTLIDTLVDDGGT